MSWESRKAKDLCKTAASRDGACTAAFCPALAQAALRGCGVAILGHIQKPTGHSPGQPVLGDPA